MVKNSAEQFYRKLQSSTDILKEAVRACVRTFLSSTMNNRQESILNSVKRLESLQSLLETEDLPPWYRSLNQQLQTALAKPNTSTADEALLMIASKILPQLESFEWQLDDAFDFDAIFEEHRKDGKIDELFEKVIGLLKKIVDERLIDSVIVLEQIKTIIATLKKSKNGSYFAQLQSWRFYVSWMKSSAHFFLEDAPVIGPIYRGLIATINEGNERFQALESSITNDLEDKLRIEFQVIDVEAKRIEPRQEGDSTEAGKLDDGSNEI